MPIAYLESFVRTPDGWRLTLFRSPPRGLRPVTPDATSRPVLLVPGAGANRFTFGLDATRSLAAVLNARGRDVWLAELRGSQSSSASRGAEISVCRKLDLDLPAVLDAIHLATGQPEVDLVGHSLGGLLALLTAGGPHSERVGRVVTVATPGTFEGFVGAHDLVVSGLARGVEALASRIGRFSIVPWAKTRGPIPHLVALQKHFLPGALDARERRLYLDHCVEDMPGGDVAQMARWIRERRLTNRHGHALDARLEAVSQPVLALASPHDRVVPMALAEAGHHRVGARDKTFRVVGRAHGHRRDYAHADLLLAASAREDVLEPIAAWLDGVAEPGRATPEIRTSPRSAKTA